MLQAVGLAVVAPVPQLKGDGLLCTAGPHVRLRQEVGRRVVGADHGVEPAPGKREVSHVGGGRTQAQAPPGGLTGGASGGVGAEIRAWRYRASRREVGVVGGGDCQRVRVEFGGSCSGAPEVVLHSDEPPSKHPKTDRSRVRTFTQTGV
ncbi:hypothetical protein GCM10010360_24870 [Streptomyces nogalater]